MFYTGVTNDLIRRVYQHKHDITGGFTQKYNVKTLVYFEHCTEIQTAIAREKPIKKWHREIKVEAIERMNPDWRDLYEDLI